MFHDVVNLDTNQLVGVRVESEKHPVSVALGNRFLWTSQSDRECVIRLIVFDGFWQGADPFGQIEIGSLVSGLGGSAFRQNLIWNLHVLRPPTDRPANPQERRSRPHRSMDRNRPY